MKMKKFLLPLSLLTILITSCGGGDNNQNNDDNNNTPENYKEVEINFSSNGGASHEISPYIYGTFIEHIETCIYNGIWSEIILDRKFYTPVGKDVSQWSVEKGEVLDESEDPFEGEHSPILTKGSSIRQNGLSLEENVSYDGYFYAKGIGKLKIAFTDGTNEIVKEFDINSASYEKINYEFVSSFTSNKAKIYFESLDGDLTIDSVSLMPSDNYHGMRIDTLEKLKELNATFYRWPGGNFVSGYDFYDGIGDRDKRPTRRNLNYCGLEENFESEEERLANDLMKIGNLGFYGAFEPNDFGLDEFILMCRYLNAEPNIVLNAGFGSAQMAKDEVEYCNGTSGKYAELRPESVPYNVKYFSIGNEMNGDWQLGHVSIREYVDRHNEFAKAIKSVDPNIEIIAVGDNASDWSQRMVDGCKSNIDLLSEHYYAERKEADVKDHILSLKDQTTYRIRNHRNLNGADGIKMAIDEYAYLNAEQPSRLKDGMGVASALNEMIKNSDVVDIACYSSTVNATQGNILTDDFGAYMEGSGYAISLYRDNMQNHYLPVSYRASGDDYYEISATINDEKDEVTISVINTTSDYLKISNSSFKEAISVDYVQGEYLESINDDSKNEITRVKKDLDGNEIFAEPQSISLFKIRI